MGATGSRLRRRASTVVHADLGRSRVGDDHRLAGENGSMVVRQKTCCRRFVLARIRTTFSGIQYSVQTINRLSARYNTRLLFTEKISMDFCCRRTDIRRRLHVTKAKNTRTVA